MKKFLAFVLALAMCLSMMVIPVFAADDVVYTDTRGNQITIPVPAAQSLALQK